MFARERYAITSIESSLCSFATAKGVRNPSIQYPTPICLSEPSDSSPLDSSKIAYLAIVGRTS